MPANPVTSLKSQRTTMAKADPSRSPPQRHIIVISCQ
jgi:hypothetical protein